jgi:hypothetical protein
MSKRPFLNKRIDELEQMFKSCGSELLTLKTLQDELAHRKTPRAISLSKTIRKALAAPQFSGRLSEPSLFESQAPKSPPPASTALPSTNLSLSGSSFTKDPTRSVGAPKRSGPPAPRPSRGEPIPFLVPAEDPKPSSSASDASMSPEEACKVLHVTLGTAWEMVETSRREIVQKSHPDNLRGLPQEDRRMLIEAAKRANIAIRIMLARRIYGAAPSRPHSEAISPTPARTCSHTASGSLDLIPKMILPS